MSLKIEPFTGERESVWDDFVAGSRNGTLFHTRRFLAYHPADRFQDASLLFMDGEKIIGVLPAAKKTEDGKSTLVSHPGASYGGLVLPMGSGMKETGEMLGLVKDYAKAQKHRSVSFLRLPPASLQIESSEDQQYWLYQQGWKMTRCEMDGAVDLSGMRESDVLESLTGKCRNMVRQAERAKVTVSLSEDFSTYWLLLEGVLKSRHGAHPTHSLAEIERLKSLLPEDIRLLAAFAAGKMVAGTVLVTINSCALYTLYMAQDYEAQKFHPMHLVLVEALKLAIREKCRALHLGVSTEDGGKKANEGLFFFKESFGCRPVRRESWQIEL
jgi:hypothetical protein